MKSRMFFAVAVIALSAPFAAPAKDAGYRIGEQELNNLVDNIGNDHRAWRRLLDSNPEGFEADDLSEGAKAVLNYVQERMERDAAFIAMMKEKYGAGSGVQSPDLSASLAKAAEAMVRVDDPNERSPRATETLRDDALRELSLEEQAARLDRMEGDMRRRYIMPKANTQPVTREELRLFSRRVADDMWEIQTEAGVAHDQWDDWLRAARAKFKE